MLQQGLCEYLDTSHLTAKSLCHSCFVQEIKSRSATTENHLRQVRHRRRLQVMPQLPHLNFFSSQFELNFFKNGPNWPSFVCAWIMKSSRSRVWQCRTLGEKKVSCELCKLDPLRNVKKKNHWKSKLHRIRRIDVLFIQCLAAGCNWFS